MWSPCAWWPGSAAAQTPPELLFQAEAQTLSGTCTGQPVRLEGNHNTVTLSGACGSLLLKGVANTVRMGVAAGGSIHVEGSGNRVSFAATGTPPVIEIWGRTTRSADPAARSRRGSGLPSRPLHRRRSLPSQVAAASRVASPAASRPAAAGPLLLAGDDQQRIADCDRPGRDRHRATAVPTSSAAAASP